MFSPVAANKSLISKCLKVLDDELSVGMLHVLVNGPATCVDLARRFQCKQSRAWKRLNELCEAGLVQRSARRGYKGSALYVALKDRVCALFDGISQIMRLITQESPG